MSNQITIKLDTESIVELLKEHATDWEVVLYFIKSYADSLFYTIDSKEIYNQMKNFYVEENINEG